MSAVTRKTNIRVVVEPRRFDSYLWVEAAIGTSGAERGEMYLLAECQRIVREIRRHVDDVFTASVVCDLVTVCEFCENDWTDSCITEEDATPEEPVGSPVCCKKAQDEWKARVI